MQHILLLLSIFSTLSLHARQVHTEHLNHGNSNFICTTATLGCICATNFLVASVLNPVAPLACTAKLCASEICCTTMAYCWRVNHLITRQPR